MWIAARRLRRSSRTCGGGNGSEADTHPDARDMDEERDVIIRQDARTATPAVATRHPQMRDCVSDIVGGNSSSSAVTATDPKEGPRGLLVI